VRVRKEVVVRGRVRKGERGGGCERGRVMVREEVVVGGGG